MCGDFYYIFFAFSWEMGDGRWAMGEGEGDVSEVLALGSAAGGGVEV